jgi:hypothetical protein
MRQLILICLGLLTLTACPPPCDSYENIAREPVPDSIIAFLPYQNGDIVHFLHSGGHIIDYSVNRWSEKTKIEDDCYTADYHYVTTKLIPNYSVFEINMNIDNNSNEVYPLQIYIGGYDCYIPTNSNYWIDYNIVDSLEVNNFTYYNVFKLKMNYNYFSNTSQPISIDSLYFNFTYGILKLKMTNNEFYALQN